MSISEIEARLIRLHLKKTGQIFVQLNRVETDFVLAACISDSRISEAPLSYTRGVHVLAFKPEQAKVFIEVFKRYQESGAIPAGITGASADLFRGTGSLLSHRINKAVESEKAGGK